jgi:ABC-type transport system involved in multi-copper enzyme maturation permease subunit
MIVTLSGIGFLSLDPDIHFSSTHILKLLLILVMTLIYIAFFLSLGILISTLTKRAASSIVILLFIWALLVFIIPNLGTLLARQVVNVPSVRALSEKRQQVWTREVLLSIKEGKRHEGRGNWADHVRTISEENDRLEEDYRIKFNRLVNLSKNINRLSPAASFVYAVTDIAGTGISGEGNLKREVIRYKDSIIAQILANWNVEKKPPFPAFTYTPRALAEIFTSGAFFDAAWLAFLNILFFALSYFVFVKYDVR